jgi:hypothetical protein
MASRHVESRFWESPSNEKPDRTDLSRTIQHQLTHRRDRRKIWRGLAILAGLVISGGLGFGAVGYCLAWLLGL